MYFLCQKFMNIDYKLHLIFSFVIRLLLIVYGTYHDNVFEVNYTDVDYKVFTDAARHVFNGSSPYNRHTYRYSPIVAIFLIPNIIVHHTFGKILFSFIDILVGLLIRLIVKNTMSEYEYKYECFVKDEKSKYNGSNLKKHGRNAGYKKLEQFGSKPVDITSDELTDRTRLKSNISMLAWLYNPLTISISTRGNCDSVAGFFVLLTIYILQSKRQYFLGGLVHGISVHFRLYPIIYSLAYFMHLSNFALYRVEERQNIIYSNSNYSFTKNISFVKQLQDTGSIPSSTLCDYDSHRLTKKKTIFKKEYFMYLIPNFNQIKLVAGCLLSLFTLTSIFYYLYGYKFLYETYIFHFIRKDARHNFSLYFYLQYLTTWVKNIGIWQKVLTVLPQIVLLAVFSVRYGLNKFALNFSILTETIVMVIYNTVLTSQYFVWIMTVLPLCLWQINLPIKKAFFSLFLWFIAQGAWLLPAYLLEFQGQNTFLFIWIQSVSFFCVNIAILGRMIKHFMPVYKKKFV